MSDGDASKFQDVAGGSVATQCAYCRYRVVSRAFGVSYCAAFPGGIPDDRRPYQGDVQSVVFEPRPDAAPEALAALYRVLDQAV